MRRLDRPDGTLVYDVVGSGPPLMLVTGLGGSRHYWANLLPALAPRFTVVTHDHMGTGDTESRRTGHSVDKLAADTLAIMDHLGIGRAHFVGHSTGAAVGQVLGAEAPERLGGLVLYAGWAGPDPHFDLCFAVRRQLLLSAGPAAYHRASPLFLYPPSWIGADASRLEALIAGMVATSPDPGTMAARIDMLLAFDRRSHLARIKPGALVVCADDDQLTPIHCSQELADTIPAARLARLPWGGHSVSQTSAQRFLEAVLPALEDDLPDTP